MSEEEEEEEEKGTRKKKTGAKRGRAPAATTAANKGKAKGKGKGKKGKPPKMSDATRAAAVEAFGMFTSEGQEGHVSAPQLRWALQALGVEMEDKEAEELCETLDGDGDGLVTQEEFLNYYEGRLGEDEDGGGGGGNAKEITQAFHLFDIESRGFITKEDLKRVARDLGEKFTSEELDEVGEILASAVLTDPMIP